MAIVEFHGAPRTLGSLMNDVFVMLGTKVLWKDVDGIIVQ